MDVRVVLPDGRRRRDRKKAPVSSRSAALRWGQAREREIILFRPSVSTPKRKEVPTLREFAERFLDGYARANRQKPSTIVTKEIILRVHLVPLFGTTRLDAITNEDVQRLKGSMRQRAPKTVNNVVTVLRVLLKTAVEWQVIDQMPCNRLRHGAAARVSAAYEEDYPHKTWSGARAYGP